MAAWRGFLWAQKGVRWTGVKVKSFIVAEVTEIVRGSHGGLADSQMTEEIPG